VDLDTLRDDVKFLKKRYSLDVKGKSEGRLVIRSVSLFILVSRTELTV
jgi:6-phosphofructokinase 1